MKSLLTFLACTAVLAACSEKPQTLGGAKQDGPAYQGTGVGAYTTPDWKPGDKTSWEQQLKARGQYGQNDYARAN